MEGVDRCRRLITRNMSHHVTGRMLQALHCAQASRLYCIVIVDDPVADPSGRVDVQQAPLAMQPRMTQGEVSPSRIGARVFLNDVCESRGDVLFHYNISTVCHETGIPATHFRNHIWPTHIFIHSSSRNPAHRIMKHPVAPDHNGKLR